jgi:hypothetical protein
METALRLNPKIIDSMEVGRLPESRTTEVVDTVPVRDSNHRQHGKGAFALDLKYKHHGKGAIA